MTYSAKTGERNSIAAALGQADSTREKLDNAMGNIYGCFKKFDEALTGEFREDKEPFILNFTPEPICPKVAEARENLQKAAMLKPSPERRKLEMLAIKAMGDASAAFGNALDKLNEQPPETRRKLYDHLGQGGLKPAIEAEESMTGISKAVGAGQKLFTNNRYFVETLFAFDKPVN